MLFFHRNIRRKLFSGNKLTIYPLNAIGQIIPIMVSLVILPGCQLPSSEPQTDLPLDSAETHRSPWQNEIEELKKAADELLYNVGNHNHEAIRNNSLPETNIGKASIADGVPKASSMTLQGFFDAVNSRSTPTPFYQPAHKYNVEVSEGRLGLVRLEGIIHRFGVPQTFEDAFFTFIKDGDIWKLFSVSYTGYQIPEEEQVFSMEAFAKGYAQVWGSTHPEFVAMFFAEDGSLRINEDDPSVGHEAIAGAAKYFMDELPDMTVRYDSLVETETGANFYWTLLATHAASGNKVNVSGYEEWIMSKGRIKTSQGHFPSDIYNQQIETGSAN